MQTNYPILEESMFQLDENEMGAYSQDDQQKQSKQQLLKNILVFGALVVGLRFVRSLLANE